MNIFFVKFFDIAAKIRPSEKKICSRCSCTFLKLTVSNNTQHSVFPPTINTLKVFMEDENICHKVSYLTQVNNPRYCKYNSQNTIN